MRERNHVQREPDGRADRVIVADAGAVVNAEQLAILVAVVDSKRVAFERAIFFAFVEPERVAFKRTFFRAFPSSVVEPVVRTEPQSYERTESESFERTISVADAGADDCRPDAGALVAANARAFAELSQRHSSLQRSLPAGRRRLGARDVERVHGHVESGDGSHG